MPVPRRLRRGYGPGANGHAGGQPDGSASATHGDPHGPILADHHPNTDTLRGADALVGRDPSAPG